MRLLFLCRSAPGVDLNVFSSKVPIVVITQGKLEDSADAAAMKSKNNDKGKDDDDKDNDTIPSLFNRMVLLIMPCSQPSVRRLMSYRLYGY